MLTAIEFDDHVGRIAGEVSDVESNRHLPAKLVVGKAAIAKQAPEGLLRPRTIAAKMTRKAAESRARGLPLIRPSRTFSHKGRRESWLGCAFLFLLPLWEKVARSAG
jgi:hypothetical protein